MELHELLEDVKDRETFVNFVKALIQNCREADELTQQNPEKFQWSGALGWENGSIDTYLDAALACFEGGKSHQDKPEEITWKRFAEFLYGGKIYE
jgi:hypothetical protein